MSIQLSDHFTYKRLVRFVIPSIVMMIFTSIYGVVDGFFVSNFTGGIPFASVNLIMPFLMVFSAVGFMVGTGGTALVSMLLGQDKPEKANEVFSLLVYFVIGLGVIMTVIGELSLRRVAILLGATDEMLPCCIRYGRIIQLALVPFMLQNMFQSFFVAAEKPRLGLRMTVTAGLTNIVLDALLVGYFRFGVTGAAFATGISEMVGGFVPLVLFFLPGSGKLHLGRTRWDGSAVWKACYNGASEFMTNISMSVVNMFYNVQLMKFAGANGVAAYGVIMYVTFIFVAIFVGYSIGSAPIIGFNYGAQNHGELKNVFRKSLRLVTIFAVCMVVSAMVLASPLARLYVGYDTQLLALTTRAFHIYSLSFAVMGFNIFGSSFFTALNNGTVSAAISFLRTFLFQIVMVLVLPAVFGIDGVWASVIFAEILSLIVTVFFWRKYRSRYHY